MRTTISVSQIIVTVCGVLSFILPLSMTTAFVIVPSSTSSIPSDPTFVLSVLSALPPTSSVRTTTTFISCLYSTSDTAASNGTPAADEQKSIKDITTYADERMIKSIDSVKINLSSIRTGRASPNMLDRVKVDYYGTATPLNQLAGISVPSSQQITVEPYDRTTMNIIERAIVDADLGLSPSSSDGNIIRINIPPLTEERRKSMMKQCKTIGEEGKIAIRNVRRDGVETIKKLEKNKSIGEDEAKDGLDTMQKLTDKRIKEIDDIVSKKEKEVMTV